MKLKEMIIKRELKPGDRMIQSSLSEKLGVSRTPLRKALGELEKEGLLESSPTGWFVKDFTVQDMISVFEIRAVLEGLACRMAAAKLGAADIAYLRTLFEEAKEEADADRFEAYYRADVKFHAVITETAGNEILTRTIETNGIIATSQLQGLYRHPRETYDEHMAILDALALKDGELAEKRMREHISQAIPLLKSGKYVLYS
jgi:DNA-binding GntR family transcriptional regulator